MPTPADEAEEEEALEDEEVGEEEDPGASAAVAPQVTPVVPAVDEPRAAAQAAAGVTTRAASVAAVDVRLTGLETANAGRPVTVSVLGTGNQSLNAAKIAIKFDSRLLKVSKVESTGAFSGELGSKLPYEVRGDVLVVDLTREGDPAAFSGQVASITFDVISAGMATLAVVPDASSLVGASGGPIGLRFGDPLQIRAR
jgi:hypothetical protein